MEQNIQKREFRELSWRTTSIYNRLKIADINELIKYRELSTILGVNDVMKECPWYVVSARKRVQKEKNMLFKTIMGIGLKRLDNCEKVLCGDESLQKIKRAAKRGTEKLKCVDTTQLSNEDKTKVFSRYSLLGAISLFTKNETIKGIESEVENKPRFLDYKPDLSQFK